MIVKARQSGQDGLAVKDLERRDRIDFAGFNLPRLDVAGPEGDFDRNLVLRAGYRRVVLIKLQHGIILVEDLNTDAISGRVSGSDAQNSAVHDPRRARAGELIIDLCSRRTVGDFNLKAVVSKNIRVLPGKVLRIDRFQRHIDVPVDQITGVVRNVNAGRGKPHFTDHRIAQNIH